MVQCTFTILWCSLFALSIVCNCSSPQCLSDSQVNRKDSRPCGEASHNITVAIPNRRRAAQQSNSVLENPSNQTTARYTPFGGIPKTTSIPTSTSDPTPTDVSASTSLSPSTSISTATGKRTGTITQTRTTKPTPGSAIYTTVRGRPPGGIPAGGNPPNVAQTPISTQTQGGDQGSGPTGGLVTITVSAPPWLSSQRPTQSPNENPFDDENPPPRPISIFVSPRPSNAALPTPRPYTAPALDPYATNYNPAPDTYNGGYSPGFQGNDNSPPPTPFPAGLKPSTKPLPKVINPRPQNAPRPQNQQPPQPYQSQPQPFPQTQAQPYPQAASPYQPTQHSPGLPPIPGANQTAFCRNGFNSQCRTGTVCMRDPRNRVDAAICVPVTQMCGGKAEVSCDAGFFCMEDPRVDCYPARGMCLGLCV